MTEPQRREPTRWLVLGGVLALVLIGVGAELLLRAAPSVERPEDLRVEDLPPLALAGVTMCTRRPDDPAAAELRAQVPPDGRISSEQVFACPRAFDQLRVTYAGEVVGELLPRRGGAWVQVNDDDYALRVGPISGHRELRGFNTGLAVWLPDGLHEQIEALGRPGRRGDVVLLTGRVLRADPADGGGITLRADRLEVLAPSVEVPAPLHVPQAIVAGGLALAATIAGVRAWARARD